MGLTRSMIRILAYDHNLQNIAEERDDQIEVCMMRNWKKNGEQVEDNMEEDNRRWENLKSDNIFQK